MSEAIMPDVVEPTPERAERAYQLDQAVHECAKDITSNFYKLALLLSCIKEEKLYRELGYETFQAYLASVDVTFSLSHIQMGLRLVRNVIANEELRQRLEPKLGFPLEGLPPSKLDAVLPAVKKLLAQNQDEKAVELLAAAKKVADGGLSRSDLRKLLQQEGFKPTQPKRYLCISHPQAATVVETDTPEDLLAQYDIVVENPHVVKGATKIQDAQETA
jgi:hypothetical protein